MMNRLRDLREDADLTQTQVAKFLGMSQTGYSKYETGENDVPTHIQLQFTASHGGAYVGSPGNTLWIDNVRLVYTDEKK